jgi:hypothetical protein
MTPLDRALRIGGAGAARRIGVVGGVYACHAMFALVVAWPIAKLFADPFVAHPRLDRVLFDPGGLYLFEALRLARVPLTSAGEGMSFGVLAGLYLGLLPLGALLFALSREDGMSLAKVMAAAGRYLSPLSLLLGIFLLVSAFTCAVPLMIANLLETQLRNGLGDRGADLVHAAFVAISLAIVAVFGVVHDLARAAVVTRGLGALDAARAGRAALGMRPAEAIGGWALRGLSMLLLVTIAARAAIHIGVETAASFGALLLVHQVVAFALVYLRADWLALALRLTAETYVSDR